MPAAAVIPAPIAYIKVVAVKKLVVGFLIEVSGPALCVVYCENLDHPCGKLSLALSCRLMEPHRLL